MLHILVSFILPGVLHLTSGFRVGTIKATGLKTFPGAHLARNAAPGNVRPTFLSPGPDPPSLPTSFRSTQVRAYDDRA